MLTDVSVLIFVYFTRGAVYLIENALPYYLLWMGPLSTELGTLIFFVYIGYLFRPVTGNPYLVVSAVEDEEEAEPIAAQGTNRVHKRVKESLDVELTPSIGAVTEQS